MGLDGAVQADLEDEPFLAAFYDEYRLCRQIQFVSFEYAENGKSKLANGPYTTGLAQLPNMGGIRDQGYLETRILLAFLEGERQGQYRAMIR